MFKGIVMLDLSQQQLSSYLQSIEGFKSIHIPAKGWLRAIRDGLKMSRRQLANRLGLSTSRIQKLEIDEVAGAVTLKTIRQTAEAMDCVFVYAVIPRVTIEETLQQQALKKARTHLQGVSHSMSLEDQSLDDGANKKMLETLADRLINQSPRTLWDE